MKNLREKVVRGLAWTSINVFAKQGLNVFIHVVLARILVPEDFGIIGMLSIFIELSLRLQGAGLGESLIRKKTVTQEEYNFVFYYGLLIGIVCYGILFFISPVIADFYEEPRLIWITRIIALNLIIIPLSGMNRVQLVKELNFNKLALIEITASLLSGVIAITLACNDYGVWSLVIQNVSLYCILMTLFVVFSRRFPTLSFDKKQSTGLFAFGSQLMIANFLQAGFKNIYNVIIGKQYSASDLGFYMQGTKLQQLPSNSINAVIKGVSFPVFANIREDKTIYNQIFRKTMRLLTFINFPVLILLAVVADPLIPLLLSEKWFNTIPFFQMLVVIGFLEPIKSLFINILKVEGQGELLIRFVIFTKIFYLIGILISIKISIYAIVISQIISAFFELCVFSTIGRNIGYGMVDFLKDVLPNLFMAISVGGAILLFNRFHVLNDITTLLIDFIIGFFLLIFVATITNNQTFMEIRQEILNRIK